MKNIGNYLTIIIHVDATWYQKPTYTMYRI